MQQLGTHKTGNIGCSVIMNIYIYIYIYIYICCNWNDKDFLIRLYYTTSPSGNGLYIVCFR